MRAGGAFDITARLAGAIVSYIVVAIILLSSSVALGLVVLIGVPVLVLLMGFVIKPLQARQAVQREEVGKLTALGADTAAGLRVLRGIGGEQAFFNRYRTRSQEVRQAGVQVALPQSTLDAAQVFIPGLFVVLVTWLGARFALAGKIDTGDLVAFYGYAAFLVLPLRTAAEAVDKLTRSYVGAKRMLAILAVKSEIAETASPVARAGRSRPAPRSQLGASRRAGAPDRARVRAARRGCGDRGPARPLRRSRRRPPRRRPAGALSIDAVRRRIVVSEADPVIFSGTLRRELDPWERADGDDERIHTAIAVANAEDVVEALPEGLDAHVDERGRSFSGGQRQRLVLARALLSDAEVLVLVEPTSAVDAHTEARIARACARRGTARRPS